MQVQKAGGEKRTSKRFITGNVSSVSGCDSIVAVEEDDSLLRSSADSERTSSLKLGFGDNDQLHPGNFQIHLAVAKCDLERRRPKFILLDRAMSDTYRSLTGAARTEQKTQGSRFLADAIPVSSRDEVEGQIARIREREPKATHHCSAYRLGRDGEDFRYDDDGEPSGTAGQPILRQIDARNLTNTLVVVTRYFGGTELGTGGLVRAYGDAASAALDRATIVERVVRIPVRIRFDYNDTSPAQQVLQQFDTEVQDSEYTDVTTLTVGVRQSQVEAFLEAFTNALSDRGELLRVGSEEKRDED